MQTDRHDILLADLYTIQSGDSCNTIETKYGITFARLNAWNPAIGDDCQSLSPGYSIYVSVASTTTSITAAAPTQTGMTSSCAGLYAIKSGNGCVAIESTYDVTFAQLYAWNPAIGDDCQYLSPGYAICVAVKFTSTTTTLTAAPTETTSSVSCSEYCTVVKGVQTGITTSCTRFYTAKKDIMLGYHNCLWYNY
jgi:LysM repeat protein